MQGRAADEASSEVPSDDEEQQRRQICSPNASWHKIRTPMDLLDNRPFGHQTVSLQAVSLEALSTQQARAGSPAKLFREISDTEFQEFADGTEGYRQLGQNYKKTLQERSDLT